MTSMSALPGRTPTARSFLLGSREEATDTFRQVLADHGVVARSGAKLGRLTSAASRVLHERLGNVAADLVEIDLTRVLIAGWRKCAALTDAAWRTRDAPNSEEIVDLASHRVRSVHRPRVDMLVNGVAVGSVEIELQLEMVMQALVATVSRGRLTAVEAGRCRLSGKLSCYDLTVAAREAELELGAVLELGAGVPLVPPRGDVPAPDLQAERGTQSRAP